MLRLTYKKTLLSGHLKGVTMDAGFNCPTMRDARYAKKQLARFTEETPNRDISGYLFAVSDIKITEQEARP